jgi:hypothetical protein
MSNDNLLTPAAHLSSFNELLTSYQLSHSQQQIHIHQVIHKKCSHCGARRKQIQLGFTERLLTCRAELFTTHFLGLKGHVNTFAAQPQTFCPVQRVVDVPMLLHELLDQLLQPSQAVLQLRVLRFELLV